MLHNTKRKNGEEPWKMKARTGTGRVLPFTQSPVRLLLKTPESLNANTTAVLHKSDHCHRALCQSCPWSSHRTAGLTARPEGRLYEALPLRAKPPWPAAAPVGSSDMLSKSEAAAAVVVASKPV